MELNGQNIELIGFVKGQIDALDRFYAVIGDGYHPTRISIKYSNHKPIFEQEVFIYESPNNIGSERYFKEEILPSKKVVEEPIIKLREMMTWNRDHVLSFNSCKKIYNEKYRLKEFEEIYEAIITNIEKLTKTWVASSYEYLIDTKDSSYRKFLLINGSNKGLVFEFGNYIH